MGKHKLKLVFPEMGFEPITDAGSSDAGKENFNREGSTEPCQSLRKALATSLL